MPLTNLKINPPGQSSPQRNTTPPTQTTNNTNDVASQDTTNTRITSPVAPAFSPLTPVFAPLDALPNSTSLTGASNPNIPPATYIPAPAPQPFSSTDSTDAIALRAAISALQFQKKKAAEDIRTLERIRRRARDEPEAFRGELKAGRVKEQKPRVEGEWRAILDDDQTDGDDDDDHDGDVDMNDRDDDDDDNDDEDDVDATTTDFPPIPAPQNVVRMPYINWDKYHISGAALEKLHEQQRRWPGSTFDYVGGGAANAGREFAVAAPWSPWLDSVGGAEGAGFGEARKDSLGMFGTPVGSGGLGGTVSEHPMETRRGGGRQVQ